MNFLYFPNIYRTMNFRRARGIGTAATIPGISFHDSFNLTHDEMEVLSFLKTRKLLVQLIMYDRIYVDLFELPIAIKFLSDIDKDMTFNLLNSGKLSYINLKETSIRCAKSNSASLFWKISAGYGSFGAVNDLDDLKTYIHKFFTIDSRFDQCLETIFNHSIKISGNISKKVISLIEQDLSNQNLLNHLNLSTTDIKTILKKDVNIINAYCEGAKCLYIARKSNINNVYLEDIVRLSVEAKVNSISAISKTKDFKNLLKYNQAQIPDIELLLINGSLTPQQLIQLSNTSQFKYFKRWFFGHQHKDKNILKEFNETVQKQCQAPIPYKVISLIGSTTLGLFFPAAGIALGVLDSLFSDKLFAQFSIEKKLKDISNHLNFEGSSMPNIILEDHPLTKTNIIFKGTKYMDVEIKY